MHVYWYVNTYSFKFLKIVNTVQTKPKILLIRMTWMK